MIKLSLEHFRNTGMSKEHLKCQEDCNVPAIGQMSGCLTTDSGCSTLGTREQ